jgi:hypothetical protein
MIEVARKFPTADGLERLAAALDMKRCQPPFRRHRPKRCQSPSDVNKAIQKAPAEKRND